MQRDIRHQPYCNNWKRSITFSVLSILKKNFTNNGTTLFAIICIGLWLTTITIDRLAPFVLPQAAFYFRPWEYMSGHHGLRRSGAQMTKKDAYGDLGNFIGVPSFQSRRTITFTSDSNGLRNKNVTISANIWVVGQSFMAGAGNDDQHTLASQLQDQLQQPVYAYAPANMSELLKGKVLDHSNPQYIVWGIVERNLTGSNDEIQKLLSMQSCYENHEATSLEHLKITTKQLLFYPTDYVRKSIISIQGVRIFKRARYALTKTHMPTVTIGQSKMLFLTQAINMLSKNAEERKIADVASAISKANDCLKSKNIKLIFMPIPNKATVYDDLLPANTPISPEEKPLIALQQELQFYGVQSTDLYSILRTNKHNDLLYWLDDTHWNSSGITLAALLVAELLQ